MKYLHALVALALWCAILTFGAFLVSEAAIHELDTGESIGEWVVSMADDDGGCND